MPKPGWAETMDPLPAQLDRITFAQWAYYKEKEDGCRRLDCEHHAAERNRNLCGSCRQGWFPARGKIGCALVAHLLDPDFDGGNVRVRRTCDCAHKTCLEIGYPPDNLSHTMLRVPHGLTEDGSETVAKQWARALGTRTELQPSRHRVASWHFNRAHLDFDGPGGRVRGLQPDVGVWKDTNEAKWCGPVPIRPLGEVIAGLRRPAGGQPAAAGMASQLEMDRREPAAPAAGCRSTRSSTGSGGGTEIEQFRREEQATAAREAAAEAAAVHAAQRG